MAQGSRKTAKRKAAKPARKVGKPPASVKPSSAQATVRGGVRPQPLIAVRDVQVSCRWYCELLGASTDAPSDHDELYDRVFVDDTLVLQLHAWDDEDHPNLDSAGAPAHGHGVLLWFELTDFDAAIARARALDVEIVQELHVNEAAQHRELWLRDLDGYVVVLASVDGEAAGASAADIN